MLKGIPGSFILMVAIHFYGHCQDGSVFEKRVTLDLKKQPVSYFFDQVHWQTGVNFSYNSSILDTEKKITLLVQNKSLFTVLRMVFKEDDYKFYEVDNQIIITKSVSTKPEFTEKPDSLPVKYYFLKGKLVDSKKGDPIPYATISFPDKPIGTITNTEGDFLIKVHPDFIHDTLYFSCMGYSPVKKIAFSLLDDDLIRMETRSIKLKEIKVSIISPEKLLLKINENIEKNYPEKEKLMTAFYRETIKQDNNYISVSEAVIQILKAPYNTSSEDEIKLVKGRRSRDVRPIQWLNFKLQGGPFAISRIDIVKTVETFLDPKQLPFYKYHVTKTLLYKELPVYVLHFEPNDPDYNTGQYFKGDIYVECETFAVVHASFGLDREGLKTATETMIRKKPFSVVAKPVYVNYDVNWHFSSGKWHFSYAKAELTIKVKSRKNEINSEFVSVTDVVVNSIEPTDLKRFPRETTIKSGDIFVELIHDYDEKFWENYNFIRPDEDLRSAFKTNFEP